MSQSRPTSDLEIARAASLVDIRQVATRYGIEEDELVEVTPRSVRLRKRVLDATTRKRQIRAAESTPA